MYNICPIFIIIFQVPNKSIIHDRYLTTQYVCDMCMICIVYVPDFLHSYYTYQIPDTCAVVKYHTHIIYMSHTYWVPDMYPIASISTSDTLYISQLNTSNPTQHLTKHIQPNTISTQHIQSNISNPSKTSNPICLIQYI